MDQIDSWFFVGKLFKKWNVYLILKLISYFEVNLLEKPRREII